MPDTTLDPRVRRLLLAEHFDDRSRQRLRDLGDVALEGLRACAHGPDRGEAAVLKARAIVALGDWPADQAVDALADAIGDRRVETRMRAATALGEVATDRAVSVLADRAERCDDGAELAAIARSLARIDRPGAADALGRVRASISTDDVRRQVDLVLDERSAD
jgi:HEAT repeat protein